MKRAASRELELWETPVRQVDSQALDHALNRVGHARISSREPTTKHCTTPQRQPRNRHHRCRRCRTFSPKLELRGPIRNLQRVYFEGASAQFNFEDRTFFREAENRPPQNAIPNIVL